MYAVIKSGGKQYKVSEGDIVKVEKLEKNVGGKVEFKDVLLVRPDDETKLKIGNPTVKNARVTGRVVQQGKDKKVDIYTYKRRKRESRHMGHRQRFTAVQIDGIKLSKPRAKKKEEEPKEEAKDNGA